MEQKEDVGTKDVEPVNSLPTTPRDWARWLTERARDGSVWLSVDQARRLALVLEGLTATVAQLEAECHRLQELRPSRCAAGVATTDVDWVRSDSRPRRCETCLHRNAWLSDPCRTCLDSGLATEYRPDPALEGGRHE